MSSSRSDTRARAEQAFKARTQDLGQQRVGFEQEAEAAARAEKTARLKALRLQKEADEASAAPVRTKSKRSSSA